MLLLQHIWGDTLDMLTDQNALPPIWKPMLQEAHPEFHPM